MEKSNKTLIILIVMVLIILSIVGIIYYADISKKIEPLTENIGDVWGGGILDSNGCFKFEQYDQSQGCYGSCGNDSECSTLEDQYCEAFELMDTIKIKSEDCFEINRQGEVGTICKESCSGKENVIRQRVRSKEKIEKPEVDEENIFKEIWLFIVEIWNGGMLDSNGCFEFEKHSKDRGCYAECESDEQCKDLDRKYREVFAVIDSLPMKADDCFPFERFDSKAQVCRLDCSNEDECKDLESKYYEGFEQYLNESDVYLDRFDDVIGDGIVYSIELDLSLGFISNKDGYPKNRAEHERIWRVFSLLIPEREYANYLDKLVLVSDGEKGIVAYVEQTPEDPTKWILVVDPADVFTKFGGFKDRERLIAVLTHEYGHLLSLNNEQADVNISSITCGRLYHTGEGCPRNESYLKTFRDNFWNDSDLKVALNFFLAQDKEARNTFYENKKDSFVTKYASRNIYEDFSESFLTFIITERPDLEFPKDEKVIFFYQFEELVGLRDKIRENMILVR
jgi:hypothetical protein